MIWVASTIDLAADGESSAVITAVLSLALMALLAGMEGLEVAVIDRWRVLYPDRTTSQLAAWLAARQLFVALIVTTATILSHRSEITIPFTSETISGATLPKVFDIVWTGFTVLWFAQIFPKHLAATNPDRYLGFLRGPLFPVVEVVRKIGVSQPAEWVARAVERRLDWPLTAEEEIQEAVLPREESLAGIWRELIPETRRRAARQPSGPDRARRAGDRRTEGASARRRRPSQGRDRKAELRGLLPGRFGQNLIGADDVHHGVDERQVRERLGKVAEVTSAVRLDLLGVEQ